MADFDAVGSRAPCLERTWTKEILQPSGTSAGISDGTEK